MFSEKAVHFGPITIAYYAICILIGALTAFFLIRREWKYKGYDVSDATDFFFNVLLVGIIGARVWYILFSLPSYYFSNPLAIFAIWEGGLAIQGGVMAGMIYGYFYFKKRNYDFWDVADTILPYVLIAQAIGRWGNFFNQEAYGSEVSYSFLKSLMLPDFIIDKMFINGAYHHPTFLYESIFCIVSFIIIRLIIRYIKLNIGQSALLYGIFYSFGRIVIEQLRTDSLMIMNIKTAQLLSVIIIIVATILFYRFDKTKTQNKLQLKRLENGK
ncbi:phosphatidylglycerol:prolipoprotein diacylglycerol transferase [Bacilli bacterium PM5-3]|nr:phosphatidylglycerol:prolipoprotein diacylglycerol transferase [Bacilli bacterium PM5-3]MDH6603611.1 phosphatidylglycerol:prolipoprotein diacylglycerol transferase [Bacilli bacterium PM5-9]